MSSVRLTAPSPAVASGSAQNSSSKELQLQDLAFNLTGWALSVGDFHQGTETYQEINAKAILEYNIPLWITKIRSHTVINGETSGPLEPPSFRPSLNLSEEETKMTDPLPEGLARFLIVGYAKYGLDSKRYHKAYPNIPHDLACTQMPCINDILSGTDGTTYVVAEMVHKKPAPYVEPVFYALLYPSSGICTPYRISKADVFFRHEYRTGAIPSIRHRQHLWVRQVAKHLVIGGIEQESSRHDQRGVGTANEATNIDIRPNAGPESTILQDTAVLERSHRMILRREAKRVIAHIEADLKYRPLPTSEGLLAFAHNAMENFEEHHASMVVKEIKKMWPRTEYVTINHVMRLKQLLETQKAEILYFHLKAILCEDIYRLEKTTTIEDEALWVGDLLQSVTRLVGFAGDEAPQPSVAPSPTLNDLKRKVEYITQ